MRNIPIIVFFVILLLGFSFIVYGASVNKNKTSDHDENKNVTIGQNKTDDDENETDDDNETHVKNITFIPWQKRNESECMQGCECHGAVVSCLTETGKIMNITAGNSGNIITIIVNRTEANTNLTIVINKTGKNETEYKNRTKLEVKLSNGRNTEIKIMPDTASQTAIARLRLKVCNETNNCTIQLKEVGQGNQTKVQYQIEAEQQYRILFLFKTKGKVSADIDSENGQVISLKKPWWAFLAKEE